MSHADLGVVLWALAEPSRRQVLDLLAARGEASASALAVALPISRQAIVKHLAVLAEAGLVDNHRAGREVVFRARPGQLYDAAEQLSALARQWDNRLAAIKRIAES